MEGKIQLIEREKSKGRNDERGKYKKNIINKIKGQNQNIGIETKEFGKGGNDTNRKWE